MGPEPINDSAPGAFPMRRFAATRVSLSVAPDLAVPGTQGTIESIHRSAVNVGWQGGLLTIAHESVGGLPRGILISPPTALNQISLAVGMRVGSDGTALRVPAALFVVYLTGAASWSPTMPAQPRLPVGARRARGGRALLTAADQAPVIGLGPLLRGLAGQSTAVGALGATCAARLVAILDALRDDDPRRAAAAAFPLIGLGPGATPSGDDLLLGLAAGLTATGHSLARPFAAGVAEHAGGRTTSLSEALLASAGRLEFAERVHHAARGVLAVDEGAMRAAVTAALAWGASSGADLMVGLLAGIQIDAPELRGCLRACATPRAVAA